jgi:hypothetical protein
MGMKQEARFAYSSTLKMKTSCSIVELSPSQEATSCAATQKLSKILWVPKVHNRVHNNNNNNNNNNSILYYLCAESTATRPITDTAQCR